MQSQINKTFQISRRDTFYYKSKTRNTDRPVFVTTYNPSLPNLNNVIKSTILSSLPQNVVKRHSKRLLAYRRPKNLRDCLVKAKLKQSPPNNANPPKIVTRCNDGRCRTCKFIAHGTPSYTFHNTGQQRKNLTKSILVFQKSGLLNQLQTLH